MKYHGKILIVFLLLTIVGCSSHPVQLTHIKENTLSEYEKLPRANVSAHSFALFGVIPISFTTREVRARNELLRISGGTDIIDPSVSSKYIWTPIGPIVRFTLEATPIRKKS